MSKHWLMALGASQMGLTVVVCLFAGLWLDKRTQTTPLFGLLGIVVGFAVGIIFLVRLIKGARNDGA